MVFSTAKPTNILVVDDDSTSLAVVTDLLKQSNFEVATVKRPMDALAILRLLKGGFDVVLSEVNMPEMTGVQLHEIITREFQIPVVLMSVESKESLAANGMATVGVLFVSKPVTANEVMDLRRIVAFNGGNCRVMEAPALAPDSGSDDAEGASAVQAAAATYKISERKDIKYRVDNITGKKKLIWTSNLHLKFLEAIRKLGLKNAVPKKILDVMDVPGLTRENVASHLQKYRIFLRKVSVIDCRDGDLRPRVPPRRFSRFSLFNNEQRPQVVPPSFGRNVTAAQQPMRFGGFSSSLLSNLRNASPSNSLSGYGQSSLLSFQRHNLPHSPQMTTNLVNPIYQRNFTPVFSPYGNGAMTSVQDGGAFGDGLPFAVVAQPRNEMLLTGDWPNHGTSGHVAVPESFDFDMIGDDDVYNFLNNQTENGNHFSPTSGNSNSSNPLSTVTTTGENPFSPSLLFNAMGHLQTPPPQQQSPYPINGTGENSSMFTPVSNFSMFDRFLADQPPYDGDGWSNLSSNNENEIAVNSYANFSSAVNYQEQNEYVPAGFDLLLESFFASIPYGGVDNRLDT